MNNVIKFLRDLARQKYESFVVFKDIASLDASNLKIDEKDISRGHFWDKQWFLEGNSDLNQVSIGFPLLAVERDTRKLQDSEALDKIWIVFAISKNSNFEEYDEATRTYLFEEMTKIILTLQSLDLVEYNSTTQLLHSSQYGGLIGARVVEFQPLIQSEEIEIFPTDVGNNGILAVSAAISLKVCVSGFTNLIALPPLITDILPKSCC